MKKNSKNNRSVLKQTAINYMQAPIFNPFNIQKHNLELMTAYAKYICDILNRRDVLNEEYILSRLNTSDKMQMLFDKFRQRMPSLQGEAIIEDIAVINGYFDQEGA